MRALASSFYILVNTFIGLALGPYVIGRVIRRRRRHGASIPGDALRTGMLSALGILASA